MTEKFFHHILISLLCAFLLNFGSDKAYCGSSPNAAANSLDTQSRSELQPPDWQIGDTWVVETEIFDHGSTMKRSDIVGWSEKQAWRFEVLGIERIDHRRCYHLQISPINGNACPYSLKIWLSTTDRHLNAFQIIYPADDDSSDRRRPRSMRKYMSGNHTPNTFFDYFKARFPSLPLWLLPQFNSSTAQAASRAAGKPGAPPKLGQKITPHSAPLPVAQDTAALPDRTAGTNNGPYHKVTLAYGDAHEIQYWEDGRPWPVYGYKTGKNGMEKMYRLTRVKRNNTPE
jgi:hypothetical protein